MQEFARPAGRALLRRLVACRRDGLLSLALSVAAVSCFAQESSPLRAVGTPELMRALAQGGYVVYFRHGHTHWQQKLIEQGMQAEGQHDLDNCATQRNLDAIGRADARRIHEALLAA